MDKLHKKQIHVFGKDAYLVGINEQGENMYLEAASWDCGWYWGFGYIETYTNNANPEKSHDINSHSHWSSLVGQQERYDLGKQCFVKSNYVHHLYDNTDIVATVLTEKESWELADLMQSFYTLKDTAEIYHSGNSHLTNTDIDLKDQDAETHINKVLIPKIFERVYQILAVE